MTPILKKVTINAPLAKVWQAIIVPELVEQWTGMPNNIKPELGYKFEFKAYEKMHGDWDRIIRCKVTELIANKKIAFTWEFELMKGETKVEIELHEVNGVTELTLTHSGFDADVEKGEFWKSSASERWRDLLSRLYHMLSEKKAIKLIADAALFSGNKTLLVKYADTNKYDLQKGWFIPDDALIHGEHPEDAVKRILSEQLGLGSQDPQLAFIESFTGGDKSWHLVFHYFVIIDENAVLKPDNDVEEMKWFELNALPDVKEIAHRGWAKYTINEILNVKNSN